MWVPYWTVPLRFTVPLTLTLKTLAKPWILTYRVFVTAIIAVFGPSTLEITDSKSSTRKAEVSNSGRGFARHAEREAPAQRPALPVRVAPTVVPRRSGPDIGHGAVLCFAR